MAVLQCSEQRAHSSALAVQPGDVGWGGSGWGGSASDQVWPQACPELPLPHEAPALGLCSWLGQHKTFGEAAPQTRDSRSLLAAFGKLRLESPCEPAQGVAR